MRRANGMRGAAAALLLTGALAVGLLGGCGSESASQDDAAQESEAIEQEAAPEDQESMGSFENEEESAEEASDQGVAADGTIDAGQFSFQLPPYWNGRVAVEQVAGGVNITLPNNSEATLATLSFYDDGEQPMVAGDIGNHLVGTVPKDGTRVEVWTHNWPWLARQTSVPGNLSEDDLRELVDLSTGGSLSYDDALAAEEQDINMAEYNFTSTALVSTVTIY